MSFSSFIIDKKPDLGILVLRIAIGGLMLLHGINKLTHGIDGISQMLESKGLPAFIAYGVYIGEVIAPLMIIIGYRTRIAAAIFAINCFVAMILAHSQDIFSLNDHGAWGVELLGLYLLGAKALYLMGGGKYAVSTTNRWD